jgi:uncharacterized protein (PEP-CTERM system associated)
VLARAAWAACACSTTVLPALAQSTGGLRISPVLDTTLSAVHRSSQTLAADDTVMQVRPGVQIAAGPPGGRLRGRLDYALDAIYRSRPDLIGQPQGQSDSLQNHLNATLYAELVERWAFVDASASISQQALSAYGQQSVDGTQRNSNRSELSQLALRPYVQGQLADWATYRVGLSADASHAQGSATPNAHSTGAIVTLASPSSGTWLGWSASGNQQRSTFGGLSTDSSRLSLSLLVRPDPEWNGSLRGGQESTTIGSLYRQTYNNWGGDLRWTPSPRTTLLIGGDQRYFGGAHQVLLEHRFPSSSVRYTSNRDAYNAASGAGFGQALTVYQILYAQFASLQPDPMLREQLVRDTLLTLHLDGNAMVAGGFVNGGTTVQRRDDLSLSYVGRRSSFTLQAFGSVTSRIDSTAPGVDRTPVRQAGFSATVGYRLAPASTLNFSVSGLRTQGTATQAGNQLKSAALSWALQFSKSLGVSLSGRYSDFGGAINPYREAALGASLNLRY